jgi:hypothetical protein
MSNNNEQGISRRGMLTGPAKLALLAGVAMGGTVTGSVPSGIEGDEPLSQMALSIG